MSSPLARTLKRSARTAHNLVSQVIVSVAAAICVAFITNAYFDKKAVLPTPPPGQTADPAAVTPSVSDMNAGPTEATIPIEAKVVWAPLHDALFDLEDVRPKETEGVRPPLPKLDAIIIDERSAPATALPPPAASHATEVFPDAITRAPIQAWLAPAPVEESRPRLFGLPLPRLPRTPGEVADAVAAAKERVMWLAPEFGRREEIATSPR